MEQNRITWSILKESFPQFMSKIMLFVSELGLDVSGFQMDHIAIRIKAPSHVDQLKEELSAVSLNNSPISNEVVNGREIMIFKLAESLIYGGFEIQCIELPYPSSTHDYKVDGWEHVEVVIPSNADTTVDFEKDFAKKFPEFDRSNPYVGEFKVSMPVVENQLANPTISIQKELGLAVKFHPRTIEEIVTTKI